MAPQNTPSLFNQMLTRGRTQTPSPPSPLWVTMAQAVGLKNGMSFYKGTQASTCSNTHTHTNTIIHPTDTHTYSYTVFSHPHVLHINTHAQRNTFLNTSRTQMSPRLYRKHSVSSTIAEQKKQLSVLCVCLSWRHSGTSLTAGHPHFVSNQNPIHNHCGALHIRTWPFYF